MRRPIGASMLLAVVLGACGTATVEETAPPPTPLPSLRTPTRSFGPTEAPEPPLPETPNPEWTYQQLMAAVPEALRSRCERATPGRGTLARVECTPATGADTLTYQLYDGEAPMRQALQALIEALPAGATDGPGCARGPGTERLPNGRRACYRAGGDAVVAWTNDLAFVLATATRADGGFAALDGFWRTAGPITP